MYLLNAFSINMLSGPATVRFYLVDSPSTIIEGSDGIVNAIGHPDTDQVVRKLLELDGTIVAEGQRLTVQLAPGDWALVAQYTGPRLREGSTRLPEGAAITWWLVEVVQ